MSETGTRAEEVFVLGEIIDEALLFVCFARNRAELVLT